MPSVLYGSIYIKLSNALHCNFSQAIIPSIVKIKGNDIDEAHVVDP